MTLKTFALSLSALAVLAAPAPAQTGERFLVAEAAAPEAAGDVLEAAAAAGQFTRFLAALQAVGYAETLRGEGPFTLFAPTDEAFRRLPPGEFERLMQPRNRDELLALLAYHVVPERVTRASVQGRVVSAEAASGYRLALDGRDGLRVNDELVVAPDIEAANGVVHGLNAVLAPPSLLAER
jgi:uncharacterized surface protein with fasciclin (FAS1) repeats